MLGELAEIIDLKDRFPRPPEPLDSTSNALLEDMEGRVFSLFSDEEILSLLEEPKEKIDPKKRCPYPPELLELTDTMMMAGNEREAISLLKDFDKRGIRVLGELATWENSERQALLISCSTFNPNQGRLF